MMDDPANEEDTLPETSFSRRLRIALKSIITGHLKDNHDDTLVEKFSSFISAEIDPELLEKIVITEDIFSLLDSQLPSISESYDLITSKGDFEVVLRLYGALFVHEKIFQLYVKNKTEKSTNVLRAYIKILHTFSSYHSLQDELNLLKYIFFTFLNQVLLHECGSRWVSCEVLSVMSTNGQMLMFELILGQLRVDNSYYVEKVIYSSLSNLFNMIFKYPSSSAIPQIESVLRAQFSQIEDFEINILLNIVDSILDKKTFFENYNIVEALMVTFKKLEFSDEKSCENAIKLIVSLSSCLEDNSFAVDTFADFANESKLSSINCFCSTSFLNSLLQIKGIPQNEFANMWFGMMQCYFRLITQPNARYNAISELPNTFCHNSILKALEEMSVAQFEQNSLKQLAKAHVSCLPFSTVKKLLMEIDLLLKCVKNRKNLNFIFLFLDRLISEYSSTGQFSVVVGIILSLYGDHFKTIPTFQKTILRSIRGIIQSWSSLSSDSIHSSLNVILSLIGEQFEHIDVTSFEDDDLLDISVETIYFIFLYCSQNDLSSCIKSMIKRLLSTEFAIVQSDCLETSTRANIVTSLFIASKFFKPENFFGELSQICAYLDRLFHDFQDYDLCFRQQFFFNFQNILKHFKLSLSDCSRFLKFASEICDGESDSELQHMLLNIIELICSQLDELFEDKQKLFQLLSTSKLFLLFHFLLNDSLVVYRVKQRTVELWTRLSPLVVSCYPSNHSSLGHDVSQVIQFFISTDLTNFINKSLEYPKLDLLEDILTTSTLTHDITMDCY